MPKFLKIALMISLLASCSKFDKRDDLSIVDANGEKIAYKVELAQTDEEMRTGLMNRTKLDEKSGMLFALGHVNVPTAMWMKDTKIPLDMIFIDRDGTIFWIYENAEPESTKLIVSPYPAFSVLEVNAGDIKKYDIKIGDTVKHKWFENAEKSTAAEPENKDGAASETAAETSVEEPSVDDTKMIATLPLNKDDAGVKPVVAGTIIGEPVATKIIRAGEDGVEIVEEKADETDKGTSEIKEEPKAETPAAADDTAEKNEAAPKPVILD